MVESHDQFTYLTTECALPRLEDKIPLGKVPTYGALLTSTGETMVNVPLRWEGRIDL